MGRKFLPLCLTGLSFLGIFSGCATTGQQEPATKMIVGLPYAKTGGNNYINTGLLSFGSLHVWDLSSGTLSSAIHIFGHDDPSDLAEPEREGSAVQQLSGGYTVEFAGELPVPRTDASFKASYESAINNESAVSLKNVETKRYKGAYKFLNQPQTAAVRQEIGKEFDARREDVRFVFIQGQILADSADFRIARGSDHKMTIAVPGKGTITVSADHSGVSSEQYKGKNSPVLLEISVLKLVPSPETLAENGTGFRFVLDTTANSATVLSPLLRGAR